MKGLSVIIADDNKRYREALYEYINSQDMLKCVAMAENGEEAVRLTRKFLPDLVILDIEMPIIDGIEATKQIRLAYPNVSVMVLSAHTYAGYAVECIKAGVSGFLPKSAPLDHLAKAICLICAGQGVFSTDVLVNICCQLGSGK